MQGLAILQPLLSSLMHLLQAVQLQQARLIQSVALLNLDILGILLTPQPNQVLTILM